MASELAPGGSCTHRGASQGYLGRRMYFFFFDGSSEGRAEDFIILLAPKSVGGQHARVKQDQGRYLPEDVTSLGLVVRNSV